MTHRINRFRARRRDAIEPSGRRFWQPGIWTGRCSSHNNGAPGFEFGYVLGHWPIRCLLLHLRLLLFDLRIGRMRTHLHIRRRKTKAWLYLAWDQCSIQFPIVSLSISIFLQSHLAISLNLSYWYNKQSDVKMMPLCAFRQTDVLLSIVCFAHNSTMNEFNTQSSIRNRTERESRRFFSKQRAQWNDYSPYRRLISICSSDIEFVSPLGN